MYSASILSKNYSSFLPGPLLQNWHHLLICPGNAVRILLLDLLKNVVPTDIMTNLSSWLSDHITQSGGTTSMNLFLRLQQMILKNDVFGLFGHGGGTSASVGDKLASFNWRTDPTTTTQLLTWVQHTRRPFYVATPKIYHTTFGGFKGIMTTQIL